MAVSEVMHQGIVIHSFIILHFEATAQDVFIGEFVDVRT